MKITWRRLEPSHWVANEVSSGLFVAGISPHESHTKRWPRYLYSLPRGEWGIVGSIARARRIVEKILERKP